MFLSILTHLYSIKHLEIVTFIFSFCVVQGNKKKKKKKKERKNINCPSCHLQNRGLYVILHWVTSGNTWLTGITNLGLCSKIYTTKLVLLSTCVISTFKFIRILLATKILRRNNGLFKETLIMIDHDSSRLKFHFRKNLNKILWKS